MTLFKVPKEDIILDIDEIVSVNIMGERYQYLKINFKGGTFMEYNCRTGADAEKIFGSIKSYMDETYGVAEPSEE